MKSLISIEQYLMENGILTCAFRGDSMKPFLKQGRDFFTVRLKTDEKCKKYDVILYRRQPNRLVLHRIISVREHDYVVLGDNCMTKEFGIRDSDIIGVVTSFRRKGKEITVADWQYRMYAQIWVSIHPLLIVFKRIYLTSKCKVKGWFYIEKVRDD